MPISKKSMEKDEKTINDYDEEEDEPTCRRTSNIPEDHILKVLWQSGMEEGICLSVMIL